jgi:hypothetical protein
VNAVMNLWVAENAGNFFTCYRPVSFSGRTLLYGVSCAFIYVGNCVLSILMQYYMKSIRDDRKERQKQRCVYYNHIKMFIQKCCFS